MEKVKNIFIGLCIAIIAILGTLLTLSVTGVLNINPSNDDNNVVDKNEENKVEVNNNSSDNTQNNNINVVKRDSLDADYRYYFQNYLPILVPSLYNVQTGGFNLSDYKSDNIIKAFIFSYYRSGACGLNLCDQDNYPTLSMNVKKSELDKITYAIFGKEGLDDYTYPIRETLGIVKLDEENYKIVWAPVGDTSRYSLTMSLVNDNENVIYQSSVWLESMGERKHIGILKFTFKYNSDKQIYYLANIEEVK